MMGQTVFARKAQHEIITRPTLFLLLSPPRSLHPTPSLHRTKKGALSSPTTNTCVACISFRPHIDGQFLAPHLRQLLSHPHLFVINPRTPSRPSIDSLHHRTTVRRNISSGKQATEAVCYLSNDPDNPLLLRPFVGFIWFAFHSIGIPDKFLPGVASGAFVVLVVGLVIWARQGARLARQRAGWRKELWRKGGGWMIGGMRKMVYSMHKFF